MFKLLKTRLKLNKDKNDRRENEKVGKERGKREQKEDWRRKKDGVIKQKFDCANKTIKTDHTGLFTELD